MPEGRFSALGAPLYRRYWLGSLGSVGATQLVMMAQAWLVFDLSGSAADLAILGAVASLPTIALTFFGGVAADRFDRRRIMLITLPLTAMTLGTLTLLTGTGLVEVWHVWMLAGLFALIAGFDWPAWQALFPQLIEHRHMMSAVSLNAMLWQGTRMIMPGLGGIIIAAFTATAVFGLATAGFVVMALVVLSLPARTRPAPGGPGSALLDGLRFIRDTPLYAVLIPLSYALMLFGTSYLQIMPLFSERLDVGPEGYGLLMSASGLGSVLGTFLAGSLQRSQRLGLLMLGGAFASAAVQLVFCAVAEWWPDHPLAYPVMATCIVLTAAAGSIFLITSMSTMQLNVPEHLRGRVMSIHSICFSLISLGALFSGSLATFIGAPLAVAIGATLVMIATLWVGFTQPSVRRLTAS